MGSTGSSTGLEIAVIGMAGRFPRADGVERFWANVCAGTTAITRFSEQELDAAGVPMQRRAQPGYVAAGGVLADAECFDAGFFGYSPRDAALLDPQQRLFLECAWHALESAAYLGARGVAVGVYAAASMSAYLLRHLLPSSELMRSLDPLEVVLSNDKDTLATRVAYHLDLRGPAVSVQTACSSSLVALHLACQGLLSGDCDLALAGGVSLRLPQHEGYLYQEGSILSPDGRCLPFDARAGGVVGGNGVAVVVLKPLAAALDDGDTIHAVVKGTAVNNDGADKVGFTAPSTYGQAAVVRAAHQISGVDGSTIGYIQAHGTGTALGDPIEIAALTQAFGADGERRGSCALGSVKALAGHLDAAAGVTGFLVAALAVEHGVIPPSPYFEAPNPALNLESSPFYVNREARPWPARLRPRRAGVSAFGMGGTNAHAVLEEPPRQQPSGPSRPYQLLPLCARTSSGLAQSRERLRRFLETDGDTPLADVAYTLGVGRRTTMPHRLAVVCGSRDEAIQGLADAPGERSKTAVQSEHRRPVVFLLPGQGSQHVGMAGGIYQHEPAFARHVDECAELLRPHLGRDIRDLIHGDAVGRAEAETLLEQTRFAQPALFTIEYALARLWRGWGVQVHALIGHSVGEYVAACLAGTIDLPDALALVAARGELMQRMPAGAMLAVHLGAADLLPLLDGEIALAASNAPAMCAVSGPTEAVRRLQRQLAERGVGTRLLRTSHAFHSAMMDPMLDDFAERVASVRLAPPRMRFVSNLTGDWITAEQATDPGYWVRHTRHTVRFHEGLRVLLQDGPQILLEVGPGNTLRTLAQQYDLFSGSHLALASLPHVRDPRPDTATLLTAFGQLWLAGAAVDFASLAGHERRRRVPLPGYPFERQRHWIDLPVAGRPDGDGQGTPPPAGQAASPAEPDTGTAASIAGGGPDEVDGVLEQIQRIWQEMLGVPRIGQDENFFELGGHSLLATQILARMRDTLHFELPASSIFEAPTVAGLADLVRKAGRTANATIAHDDDDLVEVSRMLAEIRQLSPEQLRAELAREADAEEIPEP